MGKELKFAEVMGWLDELNRRIEAVEADRKSMGNMVESAEYELSRMKSQFEHVRLEKLEPVPRSNSWTRRAPHATPDDDGASPPAPGDGFHDKLRHPENLKRGWWAKLGMER